MWKAEQIDTYSGSTLYCVTDDDGAWVAHLRAEHATAIVRAVNSHRELLEAATDQLIQDELRNRSDYDIDPGSEDEPQSTKLLRAAIERATNKAIEDNLLRDWMTGDL